MRRRIQEIAGLLFPSSSTRVEGRSAFEQLAVPYQFHPALTLGEAAIAVCLALVRIFLGSLLFAAWGSYSFLAWTTLQNPFGRALALVLLLAVFLAAMGTVMIAVNVAGRALRRV